MNRPEYIIVHTTDSRGGTLALIDKDHRENRKFSMIGYHALVLNGRRYWFGGRYRVEEDGVLKRGRSDEMIGAHCPQSGMNSRSLSIALVASRDNLPTERQADTALQQVREWMLAYGIPAERVLGHREVPGVPPEKSHCPLFDMDAFRKLL